MDSIETRIVSIRTIDRIEPLIARAQVGWIAPPLPAWELSRVKIDEDMNVWIDPVARGVISPNSVDIIFVRVGVIHPAAGASFDAFPILAIEAISAEHPAARLVRATTAFAKAKINGGPIDADALVDFKPGTYRVGALLSSEDVGYGRTAIGVRPWDWMGSIDG